MDSHKLVIKLFTDGSPDLRPDVIVPIFHAWIRDHALPDHLLIDVADYAHVVAGPGTVLVAHEANYHIDREEHRTGLMYVRKQPLAGAFAERVRTSLRAALQAAAKLEAEPSLGGALRFRTDEVMFRLNDRLLAPNTQETFASVKADLQSAFSEVCGGPVELEHRPHPLRLFEVRIKSPGSPAVTDLLSRLEPAAVERT